MQLEDLESVIYKMYKMNLTKLMHLSHKRQEDGLDLGESADYFERIKEDDRYCQISAEIDRIRECGDIKAKLRLYTLLSNFRDDISDSHLEEIRKAGAGKKSKRKVFSNANRTSKSRAEESEDKKFLESCMIKGDTSWIKK